MDEDPKVRLAKITEQLDETELQTVEISDEELGIVDQNSKAAKKEAKKIAKKLLTPEEKKQILKKRLIIGGVVGALLLIILFILPFTRWPILNTVGARGNLQITILDQSSKQPIAKTTVKLEDGSFGLTNKQGVIKFSSAKLGKRTVTVQKDGYANVTTTITNQLGTTKPKVSLKAIGIKLDVDVKNWLSGAVIEGATVVYNDSSAMSDKTGRASLIIPPTDEEKIPLVVSAPNYLEKTFTTDRDVTSREVQLVSAAKDYFVSKRDGKLDIFSSNLDGSNQQKIIEATGKEDESVEQFSISRNNKQAVLVSTRNGKITNGKLVAGIYLVDLEKSSLKMLDEGSDVQLLDWADDSIAYTKSVPELNYDDPALGRLMSLNLNGKLSELAQSNYFAIALTAQNKAFYLPADAYRTISNAVLTSQDLGSGAKKTYLADKPLRYATRASFETLEIQDAGSANYQLQIATGATKAIDHRPAGSLLFALSPSGQQTAWSDRRDGQGALLSRSVKTADERTVAKAGGLTVPVRFITDDLVVARIVTSQETADYVVSLTSGKISKVVDVSNISPSQGAVF